MGALGFVLGMALVFIPIIISKEIRDNRCDSKKKGKCTAWVDQGDDISPNCSHFDHFRCKKRIWEMP